MDVIYNDLYNMLRSDDMRKKYSLSIFVLFIYTSFLVFLLKPYLQNTLTITNKTASFVVVISFISFLVGILTIVIDNKLSQIKKE